MAADIFIIGADSSTGGQIEGVLETVGYKVQTFQGVPEALVDLEPRATHLVFIDTNTVGFELGEDLENIQRLAPGMEFILIADYQDPILEQEAAKHGVTRWIYRPFTAPEIILRVFSALEGASSVGPDGVAEVAEDANDREKSAH